MLKLALVSGEPGSAVGVPGRIASTAENRRSGEPAHGTASSCWPARMGAEDPDPVVKGQGSGQADGSLGPVFENSFY